jgi:hypothetical protein
MKLCAKCGDEIKDSSRQKFCCNSCKFWYNMIKRDNEKHLPPVRKRTPEFFSMVTGSAQLKTRGQGRRCGGRVTGAMSSAIYLRIMTEEIVPVNQENLHRHFFGNTFGLQSAKRGDGSLITLDEFLTGKFVKLTA